MSQNLQRNGQVSGFLEPSLVQIFHDGFELVRIIDGRVELNNPVTKLPVILEIYWDGKLVYRLEGGVPVINLMVPEMERLSSQPIVLSAAV